MVVRLEMPVEEKPNKITFFEEPRKFTFGGFLLGCYGLSVAIFCAYAAYEPFGGAPQTVFLGVGLLHVFIALAPLFSIYDARETAVLDSDSRKIAVEKQSVFGNSRTEYSFSDVAGFRVAPDFDPDRPEGWYLEMGLKNGARVQIPHTFNRVREPVEELAQVAARRLAG